MGAHDYAPARVHPTDEIVDESIFGFLTIDTTLTAGSQVDAGVTVDLCAEVLLAVGVGHGVIPDADFDMVAAAVAGIAVALESST